VVTATYTYDANGNRTRVVTPTQTVVASYDAQDRLLSAGTATYAHTATGEWRLKVVGTDTTRYAYDAFGNLCDVYLLTGQHVQYVADAQNRRTARVVNGVVTNRWLYQSQLAIAAEVDSAGTPVREFNYGSHGNVPELMTPARYGSRNPGSRLPLGDTPSSVDRTADWRNAATGSPGAPAPMTLRGVSTPVAPSSSTTVHSVPACCGTA